MSSAETIEQIVDAATQVAEETEGRPLRARTVAARAGVSLGTLTYYFPSLQELYEACLDRFYEEALTEVFEVLAQPRDSARQLLVQLAGRLTELGFERKYIARMRLYSNLNEGISTVRKQNVEGAMKAVTQLFPEISAVDVRLNIHSSTYLMMRYVILPEPEVAGLLKCSEAEVPSKVRQHLQRVVEELFSNE